MYSVPQDQEAASDLEALRKGADAFRKLTVQAKVAGKAAASDTMKRKLGIKFPNAKDQLEYLYIHPSRIEGQELLKGHVPKRVAERAVLDGGSVFGTEHPRLFWFATSGSLELSDVCLSVSGFGESTINVYPLDNVKENDLWRLML